MRVFVSITDRDWFEYHKKNRSTTVDWWVGSPKTGMFFENRLNDNEKVIVLFKSKINGRTSKGLYDETNSLLGVGVLSSCDRDTSTNSWSKYQTLCGCNSDKELFNLLDLSSRNSWNTSKSKKGKTFIPPQNRMISNIIIKDVVYLPEEIPLDWWRIDRFKNIVQGKSFRLNSKVGVPSIIDEKSSEEEIGMYLYNLIKSYIPNTLIP